MAGLAGLAWIVAVVLISLGGAGIVAGMDGTAGGSSAGGGRSDLTAAGDAAITGALESAAGQVTILAADVDALGIQARRALGALNGRELDVVAQAVAAGQPILARIKADEAQVARSLAVLPLVDTPEAAYRVSAAVRARAERLRAVPGSLASLDLDWSRLTTGALSAARLSAHLTDQVDAVVAAAALGRQARYKEAATALDAADSAIAAARRLRDRLTATVDVSVLDQWLDRNSAYDVALRRLYIALDGVGGRVTKRVRATIAGERAAKAALPADARGLSLIMTDIGRGAMNDAVITIEQLRGRLADAVAPGTTDGS